MSKMCVRFVAVGLAAGALSGLANAGTGRIVVANDEWTLSDTGFSTSGTPNTQNFVSSVATWFTGSATGNSFLAYSNNFGFNQSSLSAAMAGNTWTVSTAVTFTAANLLANYDAVFVGGFVANNQVLIDYVNGGGNVYLAGGTAAFSGPNGAAQNEANAWNTFLNAFDMEFEGSYNGISGNVTVTGTGHPIFNGVTRLYQNNGSSIINVTGPNAKVLVASGSDGLYAVWDMGPVIPLPTTAGMAGAGMLVLGAARRRRR